MEYDTKRKADAYLAAPATTTVNVDGVEVGYRKEEFVRRLDNKDVVKLSKHLKKIRNILEDYGATSAHIDMHKRNINRHEAEWHTDVGTTSWTHPDVRETDIPS